MKKLYLSAGFVVTSFLIYAQQTGSVSVNTDGTAADPSALLDVKSNKQGVLIPRMLGSERLAIIEPANGLLVYQTDETAGFYFFNGTIWVLLGQKGDQGDKGDKGDKGAQGVQGINGLGVPAGGTANQVLTKIDNTDYNTMWVTPSSSSSSSSASGGTVNVLSYPGDRIIYNNASTNTLTIGTNSYFKLGTNFKAGAASINFTDGSSIGQILVITYSVQAENPVAIYIDGPKIKIATSMKFLYVNDSLTFVWDGDNWIATSYTDN